MTGKPKPALVGPAQNHYWVRQEWDGPASLPLKGVHKAHFLRKPQPTHVPTSNPRLLSAARSALGTGKKGEGGGLSLQVGEKDRERDSSARGNYGGLVGVVTGRSPCG